MSAGALPPPKIIALRSDDLKSRKSHIDSNTFIEIRHAHLAAKIYFTTNGSTPSLENLKTYRHKISATNEYVGAFRLEPGKRVVKVFAVAPGERRISKVISKYFYVEDYLNEKSSKSNSSSSSRRTSIRSYSTDDEFLHDYKSERNEIKNFHNTNELLTPQPSENGTIINIQSPTPIEFVHDPNLSINTNNVNESPLPPSSLSQINYSGTQINCWGIKPDLPNGTYPHPMENGLDDLKEQKRNMHNRKEKSIECDLNDMRTKPLNSIDWTKTELMTKQSNGQGDLKEQIEHLCYQLYLYSLRNPAFRQQFTKSRLTNIVTGKAENGENDVKVQLTFAIPPEDRKIVPQRTKTPAEKPYVKSRETSPEEKVGKSILKTKRFLPPQKEIIRDPKPIKPNPKHPDLLIEEEINRGTMIPCPNFDVDNDCELLRAATKGIGTDEMTIISILGNRSMEQRLQICQTYKQMWGNDLRHHLESDLSGDFKTIIVNCLFNPVVYDCLELNEAIKGLGTNENTLIEIICSRTNFRLKQIKRVYKNEHKRTIEDDIRNDTSRHFRKLLMSLLQANRPEPELEETETDSMSFRNDNPEANRKKSGKIPLVKRIKLDRVLVRKDAEALHRAGELKKMGTDETRFNVILCSKSYAHLRAVFKEYENVAKKTIEESIKDEMSGDLKNGMLSIISCIRNRPKFFAKQLMKAMKGAGTDERTISRILLSRSEVDLQLIKKEFHKLTGNSLQKWLTEDISGDYLKFALELIKEPNERDFHIVSTKKKKESKKDIQLNEKLRALQPEDIEEDLEEIVYEETPSVPYERGETQRDCEKLYKAMKGFGTDEKAIISVICKRTPEQRMKIKETYQQMFGKNLIKHLESEISGHFEDVIVGLLRDPIEYQCHCLKKAMKGAGTDEDCLTEIIAGSSSSQLEMIKEKYEELFGKSLEKDVKSDTSGDYRRVLVSLLASSRPNNTRIHLKKCFNDAAALYKAGLHQLGTDESKFNQILCSRSNSELRQIFQEYERIAKEPLVNSLKKETSGDFRSTLISIVNCIQDRQRYFAELLYKTMKGVGTKDRQLVRICVSRCDIDMVEIKKEFEDCFGKSMGKMIYDDISGDYRRSILTITGEEHLNKK
ncbi:hypothetical protein SNEBB_008824 [Seison nebaliae]|nr:hypothetical protein SNEBB_008824 [Seison nebaliae]